MKKMIMASVLMVIMVVLSSCGAIDPLTILKANSQVQDFLDKYPNADITMTRLSAELSLQENDFVKEICGIELAEKPHYKVTLMDAESSLDIFVYIDIEINEIICLKKIGQEAVVEEKLKDDENEDKEDYKEDDKKEEPKENDCESEVKLEASEEDGKIKLEWTPYECDDFKGYKVVWSKSVEMPKYPEHGYLKYITSKGSTSFEDKIRAEKNYYAITVLTKGGKVYSNPAKVEIDMVEDDDEEKEDDSDDEEYDGECRTDESGCGIATFPCCEGYKARLWEVKTDGGCAAALCGSICIPCGNGECDENENVCNCPEDCAEIELEYAVNNGAVVLEWTPFEGDDLQYYKVVWSQTNSDLQYPDDGYIQVISDRENTRLEVPSDKFKEGTNYYRISTILEGFSNDDSKRINSNVVEIEK